MHWVFEDGCNTVNSATKETGKDNEMDSLYYASNNNIISIMSELQYLNCLLKVVGGGYYMNTFLSNLPI